jgi:ABC-type branched-subunit amino acid transport system substrate-binding protein
VSEPGRRAGPLRATALVVTVAVLALTIASIGPATAATEPLRATEIGVTDRELHIAVVADVDTPLAPGLFGGSVDAVQAFARTVNDLGGIAGRRLVVDFYDSRLNAADTLNALIRACVNDFAIVGTTALFVNNTDPMVECKDKAGNATGIPDLPELNTDPAHQRSPVSYPLIGIQRDYAESARETYTVNVGPERWLLARYGKLSGVWLHASDLKSSKYGNLPSFVASQRIGITKDAEFDVSALTIQAGYTPYVQAIKEHKSTYARSGLDVSSTVRLRKEAAIQGVTSVKAWDCSLQCYDQRLITEGGKDVEGEYVWVPFLPLEEANHNSALARYVNAVGPDDANGFGIQAWASAMLFQQVVDGIVAKDGLNALTRERFLDAISQVSDFDAGGMMGMMHPGDRRVTSCYVLLQVRHGKFRRVHPTKAGTFDCSPTNLVTLRADLEGSG